MTETTRSDSASSGRIRTGDYVNLKGLFWALAIGIAATAVITLIYIFTGIPPARRAVFLESLTTLQWAWPRPQPELILKAPLSVQLHVYGIAVALLSALTIFALPKGTGFHRTLGWTFVGAMIIVAATSIVMIWELRTGITFLHIFTVMTVVSLYSALTGIRAGNVRQHASSMIGLVLGGLLIAGVFAFIPGRLMWRVFFGG